MTDWRRSLQFKKWDSMSDVLHAGRIFHLDWVFFFLDLLVLPFWVTLFVFSPMKPCFVRCVLDKWNCGILVSWLLRFRGLFFFFLSNSHHFMLPLFCPCCKLQPASILKLMGINICFCLCILSKKKNLLLPSHENLHTCHNWVPYSSKWSCENYDLVIITSLFSICWNRNVGG